MRYPKAVKAHVKKLPVVQQFVAAVQKCCGVKTLLVGWLRRMCNGACGFTDHSM